MSQVVLGKMVAAKNGRVTLSRDFQDSRGIPTISHGFGAAALKFDRGEVLCVDEVHKPRALTSMRFRSSRTNSESHAVNDFATGFGSRISRSPAAAGERDGDDQAAREPEECGVKIMPDREGGAGNGRN